MRNNTTRVTRPAPLAVNRYTRSARVRWERILRGTSALTISGVVALIGLCPGVAATASRSGCCVPAVVGQGRPTALRPDGKRCEAVVADGRGDLVPVVLAGDGIVWVGGGLAQPPVLADVLRRGDNRRLGGAALLRLADADAAHVVEEPRERERAV